MILIEDPERKLLKKIIEIAEILYDNDITHGYSHVRRVLALSLLIGEEVEDRVDGFVLAASALLHDIGRDRCNGHHAKCAAELSDKILEVLGVPPHKRLRIKRAIETHSYSLKIEPDSIEGRILSDADKLDAMGAVGIARVFSYSGRESRSLEDSLRHFKEKILSLGNLLYTKQARKIAAERIRVTEEFVYQLQKEAEEEESFLTAYFNKYLE